VRRIAVALTLALALPGAAAAKSIIGTAKPDRIRGTIAADTIEVAGGGTDRVSCAGGRDVVTADAADRVARDCEFVSRRVSVDTLTTSPSQHRSQVEPHLAAYGSTLVAAYQVGRFVDGGASGIGWSTSRDAGRTWRSGVLPGLTLSQSPPGGTARVSDPAVAYDALHGTWLVVTLGVSLVGPSYIGISRSADGLTWSAPVLAARSNGPNLGYDKEWIACDNGAASPFRGTCYVAYSDFVANRLTVQYSRDGGATWSPGVNASSDARSDVSGAYPLVQPNGTVAVVFSAADQGFFAVRSGDGGVTWSPRVGIAPIDTSIPSDLRVPPLQTATVDAGGRIYVAWADCSLRPVCDGTDIALTSSVDAVTWSPLTRIRGLGFDRFLPALAADPAVAGKLGLLFYWRSTDSCSVATCRISTAYTVSVDGGTTWRAPQRLDARPMAYSWLAETRGGFFLGDYMGAAWSDGVFVPFFTLAQPPLKGLLQEAMFSARLR
jgi:hypothetical protein